MSADTSMVAKTRQWWEKLLADEEKLNGWLVRLYQNERDAAFRFIDFANKFCDGDMEPWYLFHFIAMQEHRHAEIVLALLHDRGINIVHPSSFTIDSSANGRYWGKVMPCAVDKDTAAGVGALAEQLSLERMRVIIDHPFTPKPIVEMFKQLEPDESLHAKALANLAGKHGISEVIDCHSAGLVALGLKMKPEGRVRALIGLGGANKGSIVNKGDLGTIEGDSIVWDKFPEERWRLANLALQSGMRVGTHYEVI